MDAETPKDNAKYTVTPNGSDEVIYSFRVKIDKKKYQSITNPGEGAGAEGGEAPADSANTAQDEAIALDTNAAVQQAMRECAATIEQCRARNKIACPYHGARIIEMDIMQRLQNLGVNAVPKVEADKDRRGRPTGTYMIQIPCMDVRSERDKVERAIDEFMRTPGVAQEEGRGSENDWTDDVHELEDGDHPSESGYNSFFEVDMLDPNASTEEEAHVDEPENDDDADEEEAEAVEEEAEPRREDTPTRAERRNQPVAADPNQEIIDYLRGQLENENLPQSVRDFLQNQLDALTPHEEEEDIEEEHEDDVNADVEEEAEPVELGDVEAAFADTPELRTEEAIELGRTVGRAMSETGVTNANNAQEVRQGNADIHDALTRLARHWGEQNRNRIFRGINDALNGTPNRDVDTYLDEAEGVLGADHPVMRAIRSRMAENAPQAQSPTEQQINDADRQHAAPQDRRAQSWEDMDPNTREYWQARYNADNGDISEISDDQLERAHDVLGEEDPLFRAILAAYNSRRAAHRQSPVSANAVHAHAGETDPMPGDGHANTQNQGASATRGQGNATNEEGTQTPTPMTRDQRLRYLQEQMEAAGLVGRPSAYDDDENDYFILGYDSEDENASLEAHIDNEGRVTYFVINNDEGVEYERGTDLADVMRRSGRNWTAPSNGSTSENNQVASQTRGQESASNAETPNQNTDARESRVLLRINNEHINDDISPDVMDALHAELRRAGRRKAELFAESGRDHTSPAYAAGKRFSSYERALNTILRSSPSNYRELLDAVNDYAKQIADSEETRRRQDGTTVTVRGFNPETGAQTTPHKRAMDAANFIGHLFGLKAELNNQNGGVRFVPINDMNDLLPPLTFETSASHTAHRQAMQAQANANAPATPPRPQPTRREFFAAPTGTEGRVDAGSDRANSIRTNAQNAANSARSSRVRNILSRIARPQQQPEERLD